MNKVKKVSISIYQLESSSGGGGGCFPSVAKIKLQNGNLVQISELHAGDHVQTGKIF